MYNKVWSAGDVVEASDLNGVNELISFGGDGSDGALNVSSGTTTIDAGNAAVVIKQYTSITIAAGATLTISNPNTNGTILILKCLGDATINGKIDLKGKGGAGGASVGSQGGGATGSQGTGALNPGFTQLLYALGPSSAKYYITILHTGHSGQGGYTGSVTYAAGGGGGGAGYADGNSGYGTMSESSGWWTGGGAGGKQAYGTGGGYLDNVFNKIALIVCGGGGGSGGNSGDNTSGAGGNGGGGLLLEVIGDIDYGADSEIDLSGNNGSNASGTNNNGAGGGGGGGGGIGKAVCKGSITDSGLAKTVTAGSGGTATKTSNNGGNGGAGYFANIELTEFN